MPQNYEQQKNEKDGHRVNQHCYIAPNENGKHYEAELDISFKTILLWVKAIISPEDNIAINEPTDLKCVEDDKCEKVYCSIEVARIFHAAPNCDHV